MAECQTSEVDATNYDKRYPVDIRSDRREAIRTAALDADDMETFDFFSENSRVFAQSLSDWFDTIELLRVRATEDEFENRPACAQAKLSTATAISKQLQLQRNKY